VTKVPEEVEDQRLRRYGVGPLRQGAGFRGFQQRTNPPQWPADVTVETPRKTPRRG
jgi:hypothetical protein